MGLVNMRLEIFIRLMLHIFADHYLSGYVKQDLNLCTFSLPMATDASDGKCFWPFRLLNQALWLMVYITINSISFRQFCKWYFLDTLHSWILRIVFRIFFMFLTGFFHSLHNVSCLFGWSFTWIIYYEGFVVFLICRCD